MMNPGEYLYTTVKRALRRRGSSLIAWCRKMGVSNIQARLALRGENVKLGDEIRDQLNDELCVDLLSLHRADRARLRNTAIKPWAVS